jgi:hypothetical protein
MEPHSAIPEVHGLRWQLILLLRALHPRLLWPLRTRENAFTILFTSIAIAATTGQEIEKNSKI